MTDDVWLGATVEHEGFPLALRIRAHADTPENRARLPRLLAITHLLAHVRPNGLPEPEYNRALEDFDHDVITALQRGDGLVVLIETFAGKRTYYSYAPLGARIAEELLWLREKYPEHQLRGSERMDATWGLVAEYRSRWPW